ncbi:MAG: hypothetical protein K6G80_05865 [Treponema sp.]|nr:hypothetical protein [Treponema sp.]
MYVDYYGVVSQSTETNILKMAQDIFLTQLKSMTNISVDDKRTGTHDPLKEKPDTSTTRAPHVVFYAEISEDTSEGEQAPSKAWVCTFTVFNPDTGLLQQKTEHYASYYKILVNARSAIEAILAPDAFPADKAEPARPLATTAAAGTAGMNLETLSGTWQGDSYIDKIILLRGGKGFVIFKNGASMNITIAVTKKETDGSITDITVTQSSNANASFFPQLPRETALSLAPTAPPIHWNLHVTDSNTLSGTKHTLFSDTGNPSTARSGSEHTVWTKK